jgi:glycerol-3-phosphate dehydrogenase
LNNSSGFVLPQLVSELYVTLTIGIKTAAALKNVFRIKFGLTIEFAKCVKVGA